jgi:hypothetical protein
MRNTYELEIRAACPMHDGLIDCYKVTVSSESMITVETILEFFERWTTEKIFQENLTRRAAAALGAQVELVGVHSGVMVRSVAP